ncbi:precorrin-3B C(17)-methyltransferase [Breoghania sp. L-A4]|nr:precorrin-3B C(17)-methyltransferase [Breoghania sp. L-A4]
MLVLNPVALATARRIQAVTGGAIHGLAGRVEGADVTFDDTMAHIRALFVAHTPIIGICAAGILIRALGAALGDKHLDSPVVAVSEDGASIVPLIGGHHGANDLARVLAGALGGHAAITTAGDTVFGVVLDAPPEGYRLANPADAKPVMAALLAGEAARIEGEADWLRQATFAKSADAAIRLVVTDAATPGDEKTLVYHPRHLAVGVGCARGCAASELRDLVMGALEEAGLAAGAVGAVVSLDLKADELAMAELAKALDAPLRVFDAAALERETPRLANPSDVVFAEVGCHGVSEGAALAAVGAGGALVVAKRKSANATVAIARAPQPLDVESIGRARGKLSIVGIGPGKDAWRTPEAGALIAEAESVVGYGLYLDLIAPLIMNTERHVFPLGAEEERVRFALELAGKGRTVALISSGDAGIYAMGALAYELVDRDPGKGGISDAARRVEIVGTPGISALQAAASRIGAPLGHDFCTISLSDLLTPWETIEQRLRAAAVGDFIVAFYNPVSKRRRTQLARARDILLEHRPADTPVVLGVNLGRAEETLRVTTLEALTVDEVDMLTVVLVGSSATRAIQRAGRTPYVYTPRGYAKKLEPALAEGIDE